MFYCRREPQRVPIDGFVSVGRSGGGVERLGRGAAAPARVPGGAAPRAGVRPVPLAVRHLGTERAAVERGAPHRPLRPRTRTRRHHQAGLPAIETLHFSLAHVRTPHSCSLALVETLFVFYLAHSNTF